MPGHSESEATVVRALAHSVGGFGSPSWPERAVAAWCGNWPLVSYSGGRLPPDGFAVAPARLGARPVAIDVATGSEINGFVS